MKILDNQDLTELLDKLLQFLNANKILKTLDGESLAIGVDVQKLVLEFAPVEDVLLACWFVYKMRKNVKEMWNGRGTATGAAV